MDPAKYPYDSLMSSGGEDCSCIFCLRRALKLRLERQDKEKESGNTD